MRIGLLAANNPVDYHVDHVVLNTVDKVRDLGISLSFNMAHYIRLHRQAAASVSCFHNPRYRRSHMPNATVIITRRRPRPTATNP